MNCLPTSPVQTNSQESLERYFNDMRKWHYQVAYNAFYAFPLHQVKGEFRPAYCAFTRRAREEGFKSCVQIQSTVAFLDDVSITEAQYYADNSVHLYAHYHKMGKRYFFASFASQRWLKFLKDLSKLLREYGFDWVVFEEPMYRVDIPGTKDRFYARFKRKFPSLNYPTRPDDTIEYMKVQELKREVLLQFYQALTNHARKLGFEKIGIVPWFFCPTFENTPIETWNSCCDIGKITFLPNVDFIIVRMQPDNIWAEAMIAANGESLPRLSYIESLAHSLGKTLVSVNNPTNEHHHYGLKDETLLPYKFWARFTLATAAAAPSGMTRHWYGQNYGRDTKHMALLSQINRYLPLLGKVKAPLAVIFSYQGLSRLLPRSWKDIWKQYWNLARHLMFEKKLPFLTFYAGSIKNCLKYHPETTVLILLEYFPIDREEIKWLRNWLGQEPDRCLLYFGARYGYRFDNHGLYSSFSPRPPEMLQLFGIKDLQPVANDDYVELKFAGKDSRQAFLSPERRIKCYGYARPYFNTKQVKTLYRAKDGTPVITRLDISKGGFLLYVGLSLDGDDLTVPLDRILHYCLKSSIAKGTNSFNVSYPYVTNCSSGILWNLTATDFLIVSNCTAEKGQYKLRLNSNQKAWDVKNSKVIRHHKLITINGLDFHIIRILTPESRLLDMQGQLYLERIEETTARTKISGYFYPDVSLRVLEPPTAVKLRGSPARRQKNYPPVARDLKFETKKIRGIYTLNLLLPGPGEHVVELYFE